MVAARLNAFIDVPTDVRRLVPIAALALLFACDRHGGADRSVAGCYTFGHEVNVFKTSTGDSTFWVVGEADILQRLRMAHDSLTSKPYEAVWTRLIAQRSSKEPDGFALSYNGLIEIQRIVEIRRASAGECP